MSKNINISITQKELTVLEYFVENKFIKANYGINASDLLQRVNDLIEETYKDVAKNLGVDVSEVRNEKDKISRTVLYRMLKKFREHGIIADGVKDGKTKSVYITLKGVEFYASIVDLSRKDANDLLEAYEQINGTWGEKFNQNVTI